MRSQAGFRPISHQQSYHRRHECRDDLRAYRRRHLHRAQSPVRHSLPLFRSEDPLMTARAETSLRLPVPLNALKNIIVFLLKSPTSAFGLFILLLLVIAAIFAPWLATHDPYVQDLAKTLQPPGQRRRQRRSTDLGGTNSTIPPHSRSPLSAKAGENSDRTGRGKRPFAPDRPKLPIRFRATTPRSPS